MDIHGRRKNMFESSIIDVSTVNVLNKYIESKEQYFRISNAFNIYYNDNKIYDIYFIISNKVPVGKRIVQTNITLTESKKIYNYNFNKPEKFVIYKKDLTNLDRTSVPKLSAPVLDFIELFFNHFDKNISDNHNNDDIIFFDNPISINAQSSKNRTGYGNEYFYDILMYDGTKYGETSEFPIVGYQAYKLSSWRDVR